MFSPFAFMASPAGPAGNLLLDLYPGAYVAYSVRKLRSAYTGYALQVIKTDNSTTQDIGFDANGDLDTAAITSFLAGGTGYVSIWYDQSGNGYDLVRGYATTQAYYGPRIANSGVVDTLNGLPALYFDNITQLARVELKNTSVTFTEDTFSTYTVSYTEDNVSNYTKYGRMLSIRGVFQDYENNSGWTTFVSNTFGLDGLYLYHNGSGVSPANFTTVKDTQLFVSALRNGTAASIKYNGGSATNATWNAVALNATRLNIGNNGSYNDSAHQGYIQEAIYYKTYESTNDSNIIDNITNYFAPPVPWTPANNANTFVWYDAADTGTITTVSGDVSQWDDKSGNGYHATQATAADRPDYGVATLNGIDLVSFGRTSTVGLDIATTPFTNRDVSLYVVQRTTTQRGNWQVNALFSKGGSNVVNILSDSTVTPLQWSTYTSTFRLASSTLTLNNPYILEVIGDNATLSAEFFLNGVADGTVSSGGFGTTSVFNNGVGYLGNDQYGSYFIGDLAEVVLVNAKDSVADRQKMEGYLAWKWGMEADLPVGHPYKLAAPTV